MRRVKLSVGIWFGLAGMLTPVYGKNHRPPQKQDKSLNEKSDGNEETDPINKLIDRNSPDMAKKVKKLASDLPWLPDWPTPDFGISIGPIIAYSSSSTKDDTGKTQTISSGELGLGAGITGIPLVPGNKGLYLAPFATYAYGKRYNMTQLAIDEPFIPESYRRILYGAQLEVLLNFYRHQLTLAQGRFLYDKLSEFNLTSVEIGNDFGLLLLPHISLHYTNNYINAFHKKWSDPSLVAIDNWLHGRLSFNLLSFFLDLGPGIMFFDSYESIFDDTGGLTDETKKVARSRIEYFKMLTGMHFFWKLGMWGEARYIYRTSEQDNLNQDPIRLPKEDLNASRSVFNQSKDTFRGNVFLGLDNLIYGMGLGWQYNVQIDHFLYAKQHKIRRNYGFGVSYRQTF